MLCAMSEQIAVRLEDGLAENARAEAAAAGTSLSEWVRGAIQRQVLQATALRARVEEDARGPLWSDDEEDALMDARHRRGIAAFADPENRSAAGGAR